MVKEIIDGIKETEARAANIVEEARKKKAEIVAKAKDEARKSVEQAHEQARETVKQALEAAAAEAERKVAEIKTQGQSERELLKQAAGQNISKAVEVVIERMLK
jgi:V/A-type H+-transporting ATPase subunit G/H